MEECPTVRLTKKVFSNEPHRSKHKTGADLRYLREAVLAAGRLSAFYNTYQAAVFADGKQSNVMPRDAIQLLTQMANQTLFVCERTHPDPAESQIVAASVLWEHEVAVPSMAADNVRGYALETFFEFGTQVSILNGFQFQWVMTAITILERLIVDPTGILIAAAFGDDHRAEEGFLNLMRFIEWKAPPATWDSMRILHLREDGQEARGVRWFRPTAASIKAAAALTLDLCENPVRSGLKLAAGTTIRFEFDEQSFQLVTFDVIRLLAQNLIKAPLGNIGDLRAAVGNRTVSDEFIAWPTP